MKVADYIINYLAKIGVSDVFLVYGAANGDLVDAFTRNEDINYVCVMHEQAGGFAAEGYAKIKGDIGVALATSGPGGQNFVTPIANCFYDSVPCLFITGQVNSRFMRPNTSIRQIGFQETDIVKICEPVVKYAKLVLDPKEIRYELEKAISIAKSGRPGPVLLDLPLNVQKTQINPDELIGYDDTLNLSYNEARI
jgi:acetolactate synthase-1/2/3 large subunit